MSDTNSRVYSRIFNLLMAVGLLGAAVPTPALLGQISVSGDVFPTDPPTNPIWNPPFSLGIGGFQSEGCLVVASGGTVNSPAGVIGNGVGSIGLATITGANARWVNTGQVRVGNGGFGTLDVDSGGFVSSLLKDQGSATSFGIGLAGPGVVNLSGANSAIHSAGVLDVGFNGGVLNVDNGATVTAARLRINGSPALGADAGVLNLNEGLVAIDNAIQLDGGTIKLNGGTLAGASLTISNFQSDSVLSICGGVLDVDLILGDLTLDGGMIVAEDVIGNMEQNGGTMAPGTSPGTTVISGNYDLNGGDVEIEIAGAIQGSQHDLITVGGFLNIDSNTAELNVSFLDDFQDAILPSDSFTILTANAGITGNFNSLSDGAMVTTIDGAGSFQINYLGTTIVLSNFVPADDPFLVGDVNCDGFVNLLDVAPFIELLSVGGFDDKADINGDGLVNLLDVDGFIGLLSGG